MCRRCGLRTFTRGYVAEIGGEFVSINIACLDDVPDAELAGLLVRVCNGRDNDWTNAPVETRYL